MTIPYREGVSRLRAETDPLDHWKLVDTLSEVVDLARKCVARTADPAEAMDEICTLLDEPGLLHDEETP